MAYNNIIVEKGDRIGTITLNRPRVLNALSDELWLELHEAVADLRDDREVKVVVFTGAGRAFSAGTDVKVAMRAMSRGEGNPAHLIHKGCDLVRNLPKPVVFGIRGYCLGGALELMLCGDIIIASETAQFAMPEINIGIPSIVEAALLVPAIGLFKAREIVLTGNYYDARWAERAGLVNEVVPEAELEKRVREVALNLASKDALALEVQKDLCNRWLTTDLVTAIDYSLLAVKRCEGSKGQVEGMTAFLEKRPARFD